MLYVAAYLSLFMFIGHIFFGMPWYLKPMLKSSLENVPKTVMHAVFHYVTVFMFLSAVALIISAHSILPISIEIVKFIGINYIIFSLTQIIIVLLSKEQKGLVKMFQWTMFLAIGILAVLA